MNAVNKSKQETPAVSTLNLTYSRLHMISTIWYVRNTMALTWYMGYTTIKYENQIKFTLDLRVSLSSLETTNLEHHTTSIREHVLDWPVAMNSDISLLSWTCDLGCLLLPQHLNPPPKNVIALFMPLYLNLESDSSEYIFVGFCFFITFILPSVLWRCWLGGRKGIRPVKNWVVGCWRGCLSGARRTLEHCHSHSLSAYPDC